LAQIIRCTLTPRTTPAGWALTIAGALLLAALDVLLSDSFLYPWNRALGIAALLSAVTLSALLARARRALAAGLFAVLAFGAMWQIASPWMARRSVLAHTDAESPAIERHFIVGYRDIASARDVVREGHVGGLFLTQRNMAGRTGEHVAAEIAELQAIRRAAGLPALIVAADQEGGPVSHLSPPLPPPPALSTLTLFPPQQRQTAARQLGAEVGSQLRSIGVTMDLAPVCDLKPATAPGLLDRETRIQTRAISADPAAAATIAAGFSAGLLEAGITPTAKHFPGLARVSTDTHLFNASLAAKEIDLTASDWIPFRAVLALPGSALMLSHVALEAVDPGVPVSRSEPVVAQLLRRQWQFDGLIITDDLTMGAVEHAGLCRAVEGALNAGVDLLLVSWDTDKTYPAMRCALEALAAGRLDPAALRRSERRLNRLAQMAPAHTPSAPTP